MRENNRSNLNFLIPMIWSPGHVLQNDRYTIESIIGHGRLSVTYRARARNGDRVVLKVPNDEASRNDFDRTISLAHQHRRTVPALQTTL